MTLSTVSYEAQFIKSSWPHPHVLLLALDRPPVNAFHEAFWQELKQSFTKAGQDPECRVVVLCSSTKHFTAGLDLSDANFSHFKGHDVARTSLILRQYITNFQSSISSIQNCDKPVIVAVHGSCFGLGIDIISACDIRLVTTTSRFSIKEVDVGLASDIGTLQRLPLVTGNDSLLRELTLTARDFGIEEASQLGLVSRGQIIDGDQEVVKLKAVQLAQAIALKSPIATLSSKHLLNYSRDHTVEEGLAYTAVWNSSALQTEDVAKSMTSIMSRSKTPPTFKSLSKL